MPGISPDIQQLLKQAGQHIARGDYAAAAAICQRALQAHSGNPLLYIRLGQALQGVGQMEEAAGCFQHALQLAPANTEAALLLGALMLHTGCYDQALSIYTQLLQRVPENVPAHIGLGRTYLQTGQPEEATACCSAALVMSPRDIDAIALAADIDDKQGRLEQALERLQPLISAGVSRSNIVLAYAAVCRSLKVPADAIDKLDGLLQGSGPMSPGDRAAIHFALGGLCDAAGEYDRAFQHYQRGNVINHRDFDRSQPEHDVTAMMKIYSPAFVRQMPRASSQSGVPVFIVGMHRSGTSLVEQILAVHPDVHGAGELPELTQMVFSLRGKPGTDCHYIDCLPRLTVTALDELSVRHLERLRALGGEARRVTDKMPGNFMYLGFIEQAFPGARIIHCRRDPLDTCLSGYFQNFGGAQTYMNDLGDLGFVYRCYQRMMAHWQQVLSLPMMDVRYEELVVSPEKVIRALVEFCGLSWDERCLSFHRSERYVNTASYDQVRQPMYTRSVGRWRHYDRHLTPLREALGEPVDMW
jgi:tetratricopeptide (TPR) repeat protein